MKKKRSFITKIGEKNYYFGLILLWMLLGILNYWRNIHAFDPMNLFSDISQLVTDHKVDLLLSQIASSFLVISLLTVLSDKGESVLWVNIIEYKLIKPKRKSFKDITGYCFFTLVLSFISMLPYFPSWSILYFFLCNVFFLMWMTRKMIEIFYNVEGIDQQLKEEYKMADVETKKEFLEKLKQNTIRCLDNKEHDKFTQNIDFMCRVYYQGDENEKSAVESHVKQILKNIAPIDAWACIYILRLMGREMKAEETIKSLLKRLIHDNVGTSAERKELIDALFKEMHEEMRTYFDGEIESICYLVASGSMKTMQNEKRKTELLMKRKHKHIDLLQYAYSMGDSETVEIIVQGFHDIWKMTYDNIESYIDENNYTAMVDIYGVIDEFPADIFSEDEKAIIAGIIEREKQLPILYPRIVTMLKCIFFNEWITEPSDEELEMAEILSGDGNEDIH